MRHLLVTAFILLAGYSMAAEEKKTFEQDVLDAIDRIAAQHGISKEEASRKARAIVTDQECWPVKGGVAIIRDDMFVLARSANGVISEGKTVTGADWKSPEIFVFAGGKYIGRVVVPKEIGDDVVVAFFTPAKVRFFDWKELSGGFYPRSHEEEPNKRPEGTPGKSPSSNPSQVPGAPHP